MLLRNEIGVHVDLEHLHEMLCETCGRVVSVQCQRQHELWHAFIAPATDHAKGKD